MEEGRIMSFRSLVAFKSYLEKDLEEFKRRSDQYSKLIGEKLRMTETSSDSDLGDLREKISEPADPKKKKPVKKKDQKGNWHELGQVSIYDGIGLRGELEIYFKALEDTKAKVEKLQKIKDSIDGLVTRGVRKDLGCTAFLGKDYLLDIAFTKSSAPVTKFSFKSSFTVDAEPIKDAVA